MEDSATEAREREEGLCSTVCAAAASHGLFEPGAPAMLMVSGGSDSVALARIMCQARGSLGIGAMAICHVDHGARGAESDADLVFVRELAAGLGLDFFSTSIDIPAIVARERGNFEDVARRERYAWASSQLDMLCENEGIPASAGRLVTGHTADDRVETFYMRSIKGFGPGGMAGMRRLSGRVARPLLDITRSDLRALLLALPLVAAPGLEPARWREDATNADDTRLRAYVREHIVPAAAAWDPSFYGVIGRSMDLVADEDAMLDASAAGIMARIAKPDCDGTVLVDAAGLAALPLPMRRRVVARVLAEVIPAGARLESAAIDEVADRHEYDGFVSTLPYGVSVRDEYGRLAFRVAPPGGTASPTLLLGQGAWLPIPGRLELGAGIAIEASEASSMPPYGAIPKDDAYVDVGDTQRLWVRGVRPGDRMAPLGMDGNMRKVSDILVDDHVPARIRGQVPVVLEGDGQGSGIVWLAGVRVSDHFKVSRRTQRLILLRLHIVHL